MTIQSFEEEAAKIGMLVGARTIRARVGHAGVLLLDFDELLPPDNRGVQRARKELLVGCPWRVESSQAVLAGFLDTDDTVVEQAIQILVDAIVIQCHLFKPSYSFRIRFSNDTSLHGFPCDTIYYSDDDQFSSPWFITGLLTQGDALGHKST